MATTTSFLTAYLLQYIHKDFHELYSKMNFIDKLLFLIVHYVDRKGYWHKLPVILGLIYLAIRRHLHQQYSLIDVGRAPKALDNEKIGTFFGRNNPSVIQECELLTPDPMVVATKLLARREFIDTGKQFNIIAAAWIQFMIHDWVDHLEDTNQVEEITAPSEVAGQCPLQSFKFFKTKKVPTGFQDVKNGHLNTRTPWWDGSVIYGSYGESLMKVRTFKDGKLKISTNGLLLHDENGVPISGDVRNSWAGVSVLQALFILEHNAVCDALKKEYPNLMCDEELYQRARLVTSAVIAKIHTIDWTVELLKTDMLHAGMRSNWYGILGKTFKDAFGHVGNATLSGFVGMKKPENHGVPYSLTEDFVGVYRMHALLPDDMLIRDISATPGSNKTLPVVGKVPMPDLVGLKGEEALESIGFMRQMVSMGHQASGALELFNYPVWFRDLIPHNVDGTDRPDHIDLAALEVYRDRERNVPRYNQFRRSLFMIPISKWEDLTDDVEAINTLKEVYGDNVEALDLVVGLMAEKKIKGFAISETSFFIFLLMASRRLEADRYFTSDFNEETYTKKGLQWVNTTESLKDVLDRHYPDMTDKWLNAASVFSVWDAPPNN